jgi:hypothetical protein
MSDHIDQLDDAAMHAAHMYVDNYYRLVDERDVGPMTDAMALAELDKIHPGGAVGFAEENALR